VKPIVSVVIVAYDSGPALERCLRSVVGQAAEVLVVDNGSGGPELEAAARLDSVSVLEPGWNTGFAAGCNLGAREAKSEILVFLNPDTVVEEGALEALARIAADPEIGIAMPRLRLLDRPKLLNSGGNVVQLSGLAWAGRYEEPAESISKLEDVPYASGAALAIRASLFRELGGFTEAFFMYQEDLELSWRARLHGLRVVITPDADVYHDYEFGRNPAKHYLLERNRLIFVLSAYPPRLLLPVAPVLFAGELALTAVALGQGWLGEKASGWAWLARHPRWLFGHRRETMRLKRVPTREVARFLTPVIDPKMVQVPRAVGIANTLMSGYWKAVRRLV
jgi:GT2 family glycosyltransferase